MTPFALTIGVLGVALLLVLFALARKTLRLIVRLALAGILIVLAAAGGFFLWWNGAFRTPLKPSDARPSPQRHSNSR